MGLSGPVAITKGKPGGRKAFNSALILDLGSFVLRFKGAPMGRRSDPLRVPLIQIPQLPGQVQRRSRRRPPRRKPPFKERPKGP